MEVRFDYGAICDPLGIQANNQGYTLGDKKEHLENLNHCMIMCFVHGLVTDTQKNTMIKKMQQKVMKQLKPLQ